MYHPSSPSLKLKEKALKIKELGNANFKRNKLETALKCYTEAVLLVPWPSAKCQEVIRESIASLPCCKQALASSMYLHAEARHPQEEDESLLATCFGNRSAVLYELGKTEECIEDIQRALSFGFPNKSEYKLYRRKACCLAQLGAERHAMEALKQAEQTIKEMGVDGQGRQDRLLKEQKLYQKKVSDFLKTENKRSPEKPRSARGHNSAYHSKHVCIKSSLEKGRYTVALQRIEPGEVIIVEEPFAAVLNREYLLSHCSCCFHGATTLLPCCACPTESYCSSECRKRAWQTYHWLECPVNHIWRKMDWNQQLCLRIVLSAKPEELHAVCCQKGFVGELGTNPGEYGRVCSLEANGEKYSSDSQRTKLEEMASELTERFGDSILSYLRALRTTELKFSQALHTSNTANPSGGGDNAEALSLSRLKEVFFHHLLQIRCNTHIVSTLTNSSLPPPMAATEEAERVVQTSEATLGNVIYPTASLMNHSCYPNVLFRFNGCQVVVVATREILAGEEINNCYGPMLGRMKQSERREELRRNYFFDCHCPACENPSPELRYREVVGAAIACPQCKGPLMEEGDSFECLECQTTLYRSVMEEKLKTLDEAREKFKMVLSSNTVKLPLLLECRELQARVLHVHNLELGRTHDAIAQTYAVQGDFKTAAYYCKLSSEAVQAALGGTSIELGHELHKLAQLYFNSSQYILALESARRAVDILRVYRGASHQDCVELSEMINLLTIQ